MLPYVLCLVFFHACLWLDSPLLTYWHMSFFVNSSFLAHFCYCYRCSYGCTASALMPKQGQIHQDSPCVFIYSCGFSLVISLLIITNPSPFDIIFMIGSVVLQFLLCRKLLSLLCTPLAALIQRLDVIYRMPHNISLDHVLKEIKS